MASVYNSGKSRPLEQYVAGASAPVLRALLVQTGYAYNADHATVAEVTNEVSVASYARVTLTGVEVVKSIANDTAEIQAAKIDFGVLESGQTVAGVVIFERETGGDLDSDPLMSFCDIAPDIALNGQNFAVNLDGVDPGGWLRLTE